MAVLVLIGLVVILIPLLLLGIIGAAFTRLGFSWIAALALVILMLAGSAIDIPLFRVRRDILRTVHGGTMVFGSGTSAGAAQQWESMVSLNLGGAVIPALASAYLLFKAASVPGTNLTVPVCGGVILVTAITFLATRVYPGSGIHVPLIIPALAALLAAFFFSGGTGVTASVAAFVSGVAGTLIGGNVALLPRIRDLETAGVSIGGRGTFGSVFICCLLPALIA